MPPKKTKKSGGGKKKMNEFMMNKEKARKANAEEFTYKNKDGVETRMPTVLSLNSTKKQKAANRRIQITFINPPHHGKGRSGTSYED